MSFSSVSRQLAVALFATALLVVFECPVSAGKMEIKPFLTPGWSYDSNYYKSATGERGVSTYSIKPGIIVGYETPKSRLSLNASLDFLRYNDEDDVPAGEVSAEENDFTAQNLRFNAESQLFDRLSIGLNESYMKTREPGNVDIYNNATERSKYSMNRLSPKLVYTFGEKFKLYSVYTNQIVDFDKAVLEDSSENRGKFDLYYNLNKRLSFDLDYQLWAMDYDRSTSDYTSNQIMLNLTRTYKNFSIKGGGGYHERSFDDDAMDNINTFTWKVTLNGRSGSSEDAMETDPTSDSRSRMELSLSQNLNDLGREDEYYTATRLDAMFSHLFMEKLDASIKGYLQNSDYEESNREDDTWNLAAALKYVMKEWVTLGCESGYENRDSNYDFEDYDGFYVTFNAEFSCNLGSR